MDVPLERKPTAEDFSPRAVERAVRNEAVQNPVSILAAAGAVGLGFWNVVMGLNPVTLVAMLGFGFASGVSYAFQYLIRGDDHARAYVERMRALRRQYEAQDVRDLEGDCRRGAFADGEKEIGELRAAYEAFEARVARGDTGEPLTQLGRDAFREGVGVIRRALAVHQARAEIDVTRLGRERDRWTQLRDRDGAPDRAVLDRQIAAHDRQLARHEELGDLLHELLARADEIESALETASLDLAVRAGREAATATGTDSRLAIALEAARRVQERALGADDRERAGDEEYLAAGRRTLSGRENAHGG